MTKIIYSSNNKYNLIFNNYVLNVFKNRHKVFYGVIILFFVGMAIPAYATETISTIPFSTTPFDVAIDSNNRIIVAQPIDNSVTVFDASGNLELTITNNTFTYLGIQKVATDSNDRIIVGDTIADNIYIFDSIGNFEKIFSVATLGDIDTDSNDRIIITDHNTPSVQVFDSDGNHEFSISNANYPDVFHYPISVTTDSNDRIIVGDQGNDSIHIFDKNGIFDFSIIPVQSIWRNNGEDVFHRYAFIDRPIAIATDSQDRIFVADNNSYGNNIHVFDSDGNYVTIIIKDQISYMWKGVFESFPEISSIVQFFEWKSIASIEIDSDDKIIVSNSNRPKTVSTIKISYPVISSDADTTSKKGGCSGDCTAPTFGKDDNGRMIVQGGFSFNGNSTDVTGFWTPYHMVTASTNSTHNFTLKTYENYGPDNVVWFHIGVVEEVGDALNDAEVLGTIYINSSKVKKVIETDKNNLWDIINATSSIENCGYITAECLELSLDVIFREELKNKVIVIEAMDNSRRTDTKFLNDGINTVGESINEPLVSYVSASNGGVFYPQERGVVELTLTSYKNDLWQDKFGYEWTSTGNGFRILDTVPVPIKEPDVMWSAMNRMNSNFPDMIIYEENRAVLIFDASTLESVLDDSFAYTYSKSMKNKLNDPTILEKMRIAEQNALSFTKDYTKNQSLYQKDAYHYWNHFGDMTLDEIKKWDAQKRLQLKTELDAQRLLEQQKYYPDNKDQRLAEKEYKLLKLEEQMRKFNESLEQ